ncbi:MAG: S8 family serine peptidase [Spirochaetia bacterium]|nr:S8 family serine peptidase [Spirochaetia bacterium]
MRFIKYFVILFIMAFLSYSPFNKPLISQSANASYNDYSVYIANIKAGKYEIVNREGTIGKVSIMGGGKKINNAPSNIEQVLINVKEIRFAKADGSVITVAGNTGIFDLMKLGTDATVLFTDAAPVPKGAYTQIRLVLDSTGNSVVISGTSYPLTIPSGSTSGLKLDGDFDVISGFFITITLNFDLDIIHDTPGNGYILRPLIHLDKVITSLPFVPGYLIVNLKQAVTISKDTYGFDNRTGIASIDALNDKYLCVAVQSYLDLFKDEPDFDLNLAQQAGFDKKYLFYFAPETDMVMAMYDYLQDSSVADVHPNTISSSSMVPNDPAANQTPDTFTVNGINYDDAQVDYLTAINAYNGWDYSAGSSSIKIAVVDSGIDDTHPDLTGRIIQGKAFYEGWCEKQVCSGCNSCTTQKVPCPKTADTSPDIYGHGTHVAGIIGATTNNSAGIAGINWSSPILSHRIMQWGQSVDPKSSFNCDNVSQPCLSNVSFQRGIVAAVNNGAKVINLSLGGEGFGVCYFPGVCFYSSSEQNSAIQYAESKNVVVVAAAGNGGSDLIGDYICPADDYYDFCALAHGLPAGLNTFLPAGFSTVISVAAMDTDDKNPLGTATVNTTDFSNFGKVDVAAPGYYILSTLPGNNYSRPFGTGTSMAAPMVSGLASLVLSINPNLTPAEVRKLIFDNARDIGSGGGNTTSGCATKTGVDDCTGHGMIDIGATLAKVNPPKTGGGGCFSGLILFWPGMYHQFGFLGMFMMFTMFRARFRVRRQK